MQSKPSVRPPVTGHPDSAKASSDRPDSSRRSTPLSARDEIAKHLFDEKGGDTLMRDRVAIEGTLEMHEQDIARGRRTEDGDKFRWRVAPGVAIRLRRERNQVEDRIKKLIAECRAEADKMLKEMYPEQPAAPDQARPIASPDTRPKPTVETEVAHQAPIQAAA
jgi:hypothetical protein